MAIELARLLTILDSYSQLTIGLVGDLFLDRYLEIAPDLAEMSLETGLEAHQVTRVRNSPGALGTVINNLAALGVAQLRPVTVIGDDGHGYDLLQQLAPLPVDKRYIFRDRGRLTPTYTKPLRPNETGDLVELSRFDVRTREPLSEETCEQVCDAVRAVFDATDAVIVLDQIEEVDCGVVNHQVRDTLRGMIDEQPKKVLFVDSRSNLAGFDFGILKGNRAELCAATGSGQDAEEAVRRLADRTGRPVYCTLGEQGILIGFPAAEPIHVEGSRVSGPLDIVGAGDAATSGIVTALLSGATHIEAAEVGNLVASITVRQIGTTGTATPVQIVDRWREIYGH
jgi:bifunctional ADP-heptose synthase (sugar kinase/adenylyltransferase)